VLASPPLAARDPVGALRHTEFWLLAALLVVLPLFEAPKNILWVLYVLVWLVNRARSGDFGGRWELWDTLIAAWIASAALSAAFAGLHHKEWNGALDVLRYGSVLWTLKRTRFDERELAILFGALAVGAVAALAHGYWRLEVTQARKFLELKSVGHVNHSAIYLAILLGATASAVAAYWRRLPASGRVAAVALLAIFAVSLFEMQSRTAIGVALAFVLILGVAWWPRARTVALATLLTVVVVVTVAVVAQVDVVRKHADRTAEGNVLAYRAQIWNTARAAWQRYPVFGVGMDNYSAIEPDAVRQWRAEAGKPFDESTFIVKSGHAHSLYYNTLAERGTVGFAALAAVLLVWAGQLLRRYPGRAGDDRAWALWGGALAAWFVTVLAGVGNTSLHSEHALLSVILLGLWLGDAHRTGYGSRDALT
jgi:O-antigen ligase